MQHNAAAVLTAGEKHAKLQLLSRLQLVGARSVHASWPGGLGKRPFSAPLPLIRFDGNSLCSPQGYIWYSIKTACRTKIGYGTHFYGG